MTWSLAAELTEVTNIVERNCGLSESLVCCIHRTSAAEVEHGPQQHRGMSVGQYEPIATRPNGILRIETHHSVPERIDQRRQCHRRSRMPRFGLLDCVHRQRANAIDRQLIQLRTGHWSGRIQYGAGNSTHVCLQLDAEADAQPADFSTWLPNS